MGLQDPHPFNFVELKDNSLRIGSKTLLLGAIFFALLITCVISFAYFLYLYIRRRRLQSAATIPISTPPTPPIPSTGLDKVTISCLPVVSYGENDNNAFKVKAGECAICLGAFEDGEIVKVLPLCFHGFHSDCVDTWLSTRSSCPLCRTSVVRVDPLGHTEGPCAV